MWYYVLFRVETLIVRRFGMSIPHGIRISSSVPATMLILDMPGSGFVGMMDEMAQPALPRVLPESSQPDLEKLSRLCTMYRIDILGPLPD